MEEVPDTDDQPNVSENADEDAASETGTDDSGLVMALDQDSTEHREDNPSVTSSMANLNSTVNKTSERTRSTISEDKAAVRSLFPLAIATALQLHCNCIATALQLHCKCIANRRANCQTGN